MAKHRAGDRRIISISLPEELAKKLDRKVGKGRDEGRSATIAKLIQQGLEGSPAPGPAPPDKHSRKAAAPEGEIRVESDTMGKLEVPADRYYGCQTARSLLTLTSLRTPCPRGLSERSGC